jgi:hypothetical protein
MASVVLGFMQLLVSVCVVCGAFYSTDSQSSVVESYKAVQNILRVRWNASIATSHDTLPCTGPKFRGHVRKTATYQQGPTINMTEEKESFRREGLPIYVWCYVRIRCLATLFFAPGISDAEDCG